MPVGSLDLNRPMGCDSGRFRFLVGSAGRGLRHVKAPCRRFLGGIFLQRLWPIAGSMLPSHRSSSTWQGKLYGLCKKLWDPSVHSWPRHMTDGDDDGQIWAPTTATGSSHAQSWLQPSKREIQACLERHAPWPLRKALEPICALQTPGYDRWQ